MRKHGERLKNFNALGRLIGLLNCWVCSSTSKVVGQLSCNLGMDAGLRITTLCGCASHGGSPVSCNTLKAATQQLSMCQERETDARTKAKNLEAKSNSVAILYPMTSHIVSCRQSTSASQRSCRASIPRVFRRSTWMAAKSQKLEGKHPT